MINAPVGSCSQGVTLLFIGVLRENALGSLVPLLFVLFPWVSRAAVGCELLLSPVPEVTEPWQVPKERDGLGQPRSTLCFLGDPNPSPGMRKHPHGWDTETALGLDEVRTHSLCPIEGPSLVLGMELSKPCSPLAADSFPAVRLGSCLQGAGPTPWCCTLPAAPTEQDPQLMASPHFRAEKGTETLRSVFFCSTQKTATDL